MAVNYHQVIDESREELKQCLANREEIEKRITELTIALRALLRFVPEPHQEEIMREIKNARRKRPSLNDAICEVLSRNERGLGSGQVREQLELSGFDIEEYSQPLSAVMTALQRLAESGRVKRSFSKGKNAIYILNPFWQG